MAQKTKRARILLKKSIILEGKGHVEKGTTLEMDRHKATELVSVGQAEFIEDDEDEEDGREIEEREQYGVRVETPTNGDPGPAVLTGDDQARPRVGKRKNKTA